MPGIALGIALGIAEHEYNYVNTWYSMPKYAAEELVYGVVAVCGYSNDVRHGMNVIYMGFYGGGHQRPVDDSYECYSLSTG